MKLYVWRTVGLNPVDDPPVNITIGPIDKESGVWPWVLPVEKAEEIFGKDDIDKIGSAPREVFLTLTLANRNE